MIKEKLLQLIQALPDGIDVAILDPKKNLEAVDGDGNSSAGIYLDYTVTTLDVLIGRDTERKKEIAVIEIETLFEDHPEQSAEDPRAQQFRDTVESLVQMEDTLRAARENLSAGRCSCGRPYSKCFFPFTSH